MRSYGTLTIEMLGDAASAADLGKVIGADLTEREVAWLVRTEWARSAEDILWRRSKLGLRFDHAQRTRLAALVAKAVSSAAHSPGILTPRAEPVAGGPGA